MRSILKQDHYFLCHKKSLLTRHLVGRWIESTDTKGRGGGWECLSELMKYGWTVITAVQPSCSQVFQDTGQLSNGSPKDVDVLIPRSGECYFTLQKKDFQIWQIRNLELGRGSRIHQVATMQSSISTGGAADMRNTKEKGTWWWKQLLALKTEKAPGTPEWNSRSWEKPPEGPQTWWPPWFQPTGTDFRLLAFRLMKSKSVLF